jgi:WAS/WASL-interacting protein
MNNRPLPPSFNRSPPQQQQEVPLTEGGGRFTFRPTSDLPPPRTGFSKKHHVYPSGEQRGNSK